MTIGPLRPSCRLSTGKPFSDHISGNADGNVRGYVGGILQTIHTCAGCYGFMGTGGQERLPFLGRNSFRYGNFYNTDLRLSRRIHFGESKNLEFLAEAFNLFNHQNVTRRSSTLYSVFNSTLGYDGNFNTPIAAANTLYREREIQLAARFHF